METCSASPARRRELIFGARSERMEFDAGYAIDPDEFANEPEQLITLLFLLAIMAIFVMTIGVAILVGFLKPHWFRLNIYPDPLPQMADCSCLNVCCPCNSCSFRQLIANCCPRLNLKQRFNCVQTCCNRDAPTKINLVCCVV